ncbi:nuclear RNA export factor 1-like isoform X1 [Gouania willdenowi]|uniref:nuclear RNA export factor 1-like isoform X1 n=1 Tax=Gouania willdenowi TaxID=441366 RepID=UPI0010542A60|nr:nuclear RNA export factor 1-like isoform X1 [Gouania willdenowi]
MRFHLLKHTRLNVVTLLNELPKTQHDIISFTVDVNAYTNTLLSFTVGGVFKEVVVDDKSKESTRFSSQFQQWILVCASSTTSSSSEWLQRSRSAELLCPAPFLQPSAHPHCPTAGDAQHLLPEVRHEPGMVPEVFAGQQVGLEQSSTYLHSVKDGGKDPRRS